MVCSLDTSLPTLERLEPRQLLHGFHGGADVAHGLRAEYFDNADFTGSQGSRVTRRVNFNFRDGSPAPSVGSDTFSIRWRGKVTPMRSGFVTFHLRADDAAKLWIGGKPVVHAQGKTAQASGRIRLRAGTLYDLRLDYVEQQGDASITLYWSAKGHKKRIVPREHLFPAPEPQKPVDPKDPPDEEPPVDPPVEKLSWSSLPSMPVSLGEVAGGIIGNKLYLVGEGSSATLSLDLTSRTWSSTSAHPARPFVGHHHAAEVFDGKLYVIGGFAGGSAGKVQIFDPSANEWASGRSMPFATSSATSALIDNEIYVAGGIIGNSTTRRVAKYDPRTDTWTELAPMPQGRNHAAGGTDGSRFYVFGGRGPGSGDSNMVANGFDTVQFYDPATNRWVSSADASSGIAPLPQARGGMGKAVFSGGEFFVMGGETASGAGATDDGVYSRVDIYDPAANSWRRGPEMPTARHGIFPLTFGSRIYVAGGGTRAGFSASPIVQVLNRG